MGQFQFAFTRNNAVAHFSLSARANDVHAAIAAFLLAPPKSFRTAAELQLYITDV